MMPPSLTWQNAASLFLLCFLLTPHTNFPEGTISPTTLLSVITLPVTKLPWPVRPENYHSVSTFPSIQFINKLFCLQTSLLFFLSCLPLYTLKMPVSHFFLFCWCCGIVYIHIRCTHLKWKVNEPWQINIPRWPLHNNQYIEHFHHPRKCPCVPFRRSLALSNAHPWHQETTFLTDIPINHTSLF